MVNHLGASNKIESLLGFFRFEAFRFFQNKIGIPT